VNAFASDRKVFTRPSSSKTPGRNRTATFFTARIVVLTSVDIDASLARTGGVSVTV
jgi:hypothetical protein